MLLRAVSTGPIHTRHVIIFLHFLYLRELVWDSCLARSQGQVYIVESKTPAVVLGLPKSFEYILSSTN